MIAGERFDSHVDRSGDCWLWTGHINRNGYAQFRYGGRNGTRIYVHRFAYERVNGPIPDGQEIDHVCRTRHCVNPAHLEPVTRSVNMQRAAPYRPRHYNVGDTCKSGHPRTPDNTGVNNVGRRYCRPCHREAVRRCKASALITA